MSPVHDDDMEDPLDEELRHEEPRGRVPELIRKMAVAGLGALFMTEESLRTVTGQLKLPKEVLGHLLAQAEKTKDEVGRIASEEIRRFLQSDTLREELLKLLSGTTVEIKAQVRLVLPSDASRDADGAPGRVVVSELKARHARRSGKKE